MSCRRQVRSARGSIRRRVRQTGLSIRARRVTGPQLGPDGKPKRRVTIACGRCRQRKIRCSGQRPDGVPCDACLLSGCNVCEYLRVSSQATAMRSDLTAPIEQQDLGVAFTQSQMYAFQSPPLDGALYRNHLTQQYPPNLPSNMRPYPSMFELSTSYNFPEFTITYDTPSPQILNTPLAYNINNFGNPNDRRYSSPSIESRSPILEMTTMAPYQSQGGCFTKAHNG